LEQFAEDQSSECMSLSLRGHGMYESEFVWKKKNMKLKIYGKLSQNWSDSLSRMLSHMIKKLLFSVSSSTHLTIAQKGIVS